VETIFEKRGVSIAVTAIVRPQDGLEAILVTRAN
jgi:hypothetical protein